jgi:hypothetical protein
MKSMRVADLKPRDDVLWWAHWGQDGKQAMLSGRYQTPSEYYGELLVHMQRGGKIPPLKVGPWHYGEPGQIYVMDGHHRYALARNLGWDYVPVVDADPDYVISPRWQPETL